MKCLKVEFLLCIFSLIFCEQSRSQVCKAGDIFSNYTDIKPDTFINFSCIYHHSIENYYFDVNRDLQNDFRITAACDVALGAQSQFIGIYCLNSNSYVSLGHIDSAYHTYFATWMTAKVAKVYYRGDSINSYNTEWYSTYLNLNYSSSSAGSFIEGSPWRNPNDEYIGIKYRSSTDTLYGWIRVNCSDPTGCTILDYSIGSLHEKAKAPEFDNFILYPNPASKELTLITLSQTSIDLINTDGQLIKQINGTGPVTKISLEDLSRGVYIVRVSTENKVAIKKIIIY